MIILSIIIVNHNAEKVTLDCIKSIVEKTRISHEIILIDNVSTDNTVLEVKRRYPNVIVIENRVNKGFASANNQGMSIARGKYVILLNNDTALKNDALDQMVAFMDKNPKVGVLTCKLYEADGITIQRNCRSFYLTPFDTMFGRASLLSKLFPNNPITRRNTLSDWDYNSERQVDWVSGACMMVRREVFDQIGLLDENFFMYWEDTDFCKRARDAGWEIWFTPKAEIIHFSGMGGGKRSLWLKLFMIFQMHRSAYYYFRKHYYKNPLHPMAVVTFIGMIVLIAGKCANTIFQSLRFRSWL